MSDIILDNVSYHSSDKVLISNMHLSMDLTKPAFIMGHNGAGKSLTLKLLMGLLVPTKGRVVYANKAWINCPGKMSYLGQSVATLQRTVYDNIAFALKQCRVEKSMFKTIIDEALTQTALENKVNQMAYKLSGGEKQRLALSRAIAMQSEVLLLDEPSSNMSPGATKKFEQILLNMHGQIKIIMVSHNIAQIKRLSYILGGNIYFIENGRCLEVSPANHFLKMPATKQAKDFLNENAIW